MDLGRLDELITLLAQQGRGVTISPVSKGSRLGGIGSETRYAFDGWEIGYIAGWGGDELAVGATIPEAVAAAITALQEDD